LEDVSPIITKAERSVFTKLETNADRAKFVHFFWRMRDSLPDTTENEFQKDYEERVRYADQNFGHDSPKRGSQTDRGFFYVALGKPLERTFYTTQSQVWPLELWFYKGEQEYGLPPYFYLIFYQRDGIGDFRLYSPGVEGPEKLVIPTLGTAVNRSTAVNAIKAINGELARASLSYLPSESPMGGVSFASDTIIASVRDLPEKKYSDSYARSYMSFKDFIETDYTDNYLQSIYQVRVFLEGGQTFLHWSIEPEKMNFAAQGNMVYASFEFVLRLEDGRGRTVHESTDEIPLRITPEQYKAHERQRFAFQDLLAVVPGEYRVLFLLKNKTARDFSSFETRVVVPAAETVARASLSTPLLYYARSAVPEAQKKNLKAFVFGGQQYLVGARNEFPSSSTLGIFVQARNVAERTASAPPLFFVNLVALDTNQSAGVFPLTDIAPDPGDGATLLVSGAAPLKDVKPGYYRAEVSLRSPDGQSLLTEKENFVVLGEPFPVIPWVYGRLHGPFPGPEHLRALGSQYFLEGDYARSREICERALRAGDDPSTRLLLAKSLYGLGLYKESLEHATAVHDRGGDRESAKVIALDQAGLKDWAAALSTLEKLMAGATEIPVLNLASECHMALGHPERALPLLQKSLALVPDQPAVRALEEEAKKRIGQR
ncbi:MAG: GWxTD domain-containing protein, partial [Candidatus Aminicenantes bacterium RBG_16_66_30]